MSAKQEILVSERYDEVVTQGEGLLDENPKTPLSHSWKDHLKPRFLHSFIGWRAGVLLWATITAGVCTLNIAWTIWASSQHHVKDGVSYLYTGSCKTTGRMSFWLHICINILSTLLLSASNYTMQVISSPTRAEVDKAHQASKWLDIGVPGVRNLRFISQTRVVWWALLAVSSIPLHLLYNSAIFQSLSSNDYDYIEVTENFLLPTAVINTTLYTDTYDQNELPVILEMHNAALNGSLVRFDSADCMAEYASTFVSKARNVLLVSTSPANYTYEDDVLSFNTGDTLAYQIPYWWICGQYFDYTTRADYWATWDGDPYNGHDAVCTLPIAISLASNWTVSSELQPIAYCMVQVTPEECSLRFSFPIMVIVIIANLVKLLVIVVVLVTHKASTLVTVGDAVASFLERPDPYTSGRCLATREDILKTRGQWEIQPAKQWVGRRYFWIKATSWKRLITCYVLCLTVMIIGIACFASGTATLGTSQISTLYSIGFGTVSPDAIVHFGTGGLVPTILFANLPQAVLSFLYLFYNGLYSSFLSAHEWSKFGHTRKSLRVTSPQGPQRSTYFLSLPYRYAIPLMILSCTLHWLISQSLFLAFVTLSDDLGVVNESQSIAKLGFSCIAIFCSIIVGAVALLASFIMGFRRYSPGIPVVGSCSAAIAATCHRLPEDTDAAVLPVQWGVVVDGYVGHCCFSSLPVAEPVKGHLYAGFHLKEE